MLGTQSCHLGVSNNCQQHLLSGAPHGPPVLYLCESQALICLLSKSTDLYIRDGPQRLLRALGNTTRRSCGPEVSAEVSLNLSVGVASSMYKGQDPSRLFTSAELTAQTELQFVSPGMETGDTWI